MAYSAVIIFFVALCIGSAFQYKILNQEEKLSPVEDCAAGSWILSKENVVVPCRPLAPPPVVEDTNNCTVALSNLFGQTIQQGAFFHLINNEQDPDHRLTFQNLTTGESTEILEISYDTNKTDYWWVLFTVGKDTYTVVGNFICSIPEGYTDKVTLQVRKDDTLVVSFVGAGNRGCSTPLIKLTASNYNVQ